MMVYCKFMINQFQKHQEENKDLGVRARVSKEEMMMQIAELVATRSTCKRLHVGAVLTDEKMFNISAFGFNGNYSGGPNTCDSDEIGNCGCTHSEIGCLVKGKGSILFITDSPCLACTKVIINAGVKKVYYRNEYRKTEGLDLLKKMNIETIQLCDQSPLF